MVEYLRILLIMWLARVEAMSGDRKHPSYGDGGRHLPADERDGEPEGLADGGH